MAALVVGPTVSRSLAPVGGPVASAHAHCEGMEAAAPTGAPPSGHDSRTHDSFERCELCVVAALPALQSTPAVWLRAATGRAHAATALPPSAAPLRPTWSPASPRGPPVPT